MQIHIVEEGETVDAIAQAYGVPVEILILDNQLVYPYRLAIGQALYIPVYDSSGERPLAQISGYAYPYISPWVLGQTLPFLTELPIFSYGFTDDGWLVPPATEESWMIEMCEAQGVIPFLTLTPLDAQGKFNNALIASVVWNSVAGDRLILELIRTMQEKGYGGVDIDFEYIRREDRDAFTEFVRRATVIFHEFGFRVSIALAPKTSADQKGLLYEGKDYPALGGIADSVLLMTYEWGYKYGPNMAVAPIHKVEQVVQYAVTEIPAAKIRMGIPNYGYDWSLPYVPNVTVANTIGNVEAVQIAITHFARIQYDETAQSPYFRYWQDDVEHEVWFEDVRSLEAKFNLVKNYGLQGMGYWQIMRWWRANWLALEDTFVIQKE